MSRTHPYVVSVCGSLRAESRTRIAVQEILQAADRAGATTDLIDLRDYELPPLHAADTDVPDAEQFRETVEQADSLVLGTPNYHGSYSGALKNALDYCKRDDLDGTTVGLLEVAAGEFPGSAIEHLRRVSRTLNGWPLPKAVAIPNSHDVVTDAGVADQEIAERIERLGRHLVKYAGVSEYPPTDVSGGKAASTGEADD